MATLFSCYKDDLQQSMLRFIMQPEHLLVTWSRIIKDDFKLNNPEVSEVSGVSCHMVGNVNVLNQQIKLLQDLSFWINDVTVE